MKFQPPVYFSFDKIKNGTILTPKRMNEFPYPDLKMGWLYKRLFFFFFLEKGNFWLFFLFLYFLCLFFDSLLERLSDTSESGLVLNKRRGIRGCLEPDLQIARS